MSSIERRISKIEAERAAIDRPTLFVWKHQTETDAEAIARAAAGDRPVMLLSWSGDGATLH